MIKITEDNTDCLGIGAIVKVLNHLNKKYINKFGIIVSYDKEDIDELNYLQTNFELKLLDIPDELSDPITNSEVANVIHEYKTKVADESIYIQDSKDFDLMMWSCGIVVGGTRGGNLELTCTAE